MLQVVVTCRSERTIYTEVLRQRQKDLSIPDLFKVDAEGLELQVRKCSHLQGKRRYCVQCAGASLNAKNIITL